MESDSDPNMDPAACSSALVSTAPLQVGLTEAAGGRQVTANNAAEYLALRREYKGLETPLTGKPFSCCLISDKHRPE